MSWSHLYKRPISNLQHHQTPQAEKSADYTEFSSIRKSEQVFCCPVTINIGRSKVIIEKSRGEVSLMEQDTIENVSEPIKNLKFFFF